ncbi:hypothetical protein [Kitasatospora purpeofusca]|uniref:hypothetical protein n=1 Tax=Kitasatospora purpeofusca TaxID=67352 RepID=UPI002A5A5969|nr:hypothetical protein [Kitasatospora purpeofusca]MDY0811401.1 hypothetical protein [Kitasatospora purpeofusca]
MIDTTVGQLASLALHRRRITTSNGGRAPYLVVALPGGTEIRISDDRADITITPDQLTGLTATHHLGDPETNPGHAVTIHQRALGDTSPANAIEALAHDVSTYITRWNSTPAARHPERPINEFGAMDLPSRWLRPGDIIVHTATGHESVVTHIHHLGRSEYRRTTRTVTPPTRGGMKALPDTWWQFPTTFRPTGNTPVTVYAHRHIDPNSLPPIPYPPVPARLADGDHIVHDGEIWGRTGGFWFNQNRRRNTPPVTDEVARRWFTEHASLRKGIPVHQPAHPATTVRAVTA